MKNSDVMQLAKWGLVIAGGVYVYNRLTSVTTPGEVATNAYWGSSLGDLSAALSDFYTNGWGDWGDSWDPFSPEQAARAQDIANGVNQQIGWNSGSLGSL